MWVYFLVFFLCLLVSISYVFIIWQFVKRTTKEDIPSPFSFSKKFWRELKKFGFVYFVGDMTKFIVEILILWPGNAIVVRLVGIMITFTTSGFFGRWRTLVLKKIKQDVKSHYKFREFMGDTFASLVFWVPMYITQVMILVAFDLTHRSNLWYSVYVTIISILLFWRFGCIVADYLEKKFSKRKKKK